MYNENNNPSRVPTPRYSCPLHGRIWAVKIENGVVRCRFCNSMVLRNPTVFVSPSGSTSPRTKSVSVTTAQTEEEFGLLELISCLIGVIIAIVLLGGR